MISNKRSRKILAHCNQYHYITDSKLEIDKELNIISLHKGHGCAFPPSPPTSKSVCTCYFCQLKHHCIILSSAHFRHLGHDANRKSYELHTLVQTYKRAPNICKTLVSTLCGFFLFSKCSPLIPFLIRKKHISYGNTYLSIFSVTMIMHLKFFIYLFFWIVMSTKIIHAKFISPFNLCILGPIFHIDSQNKL